jgi:hypothetical protein
MPAGQASCTSGHRSSLAAQSHPTELPGRLGSSPSLSRPTRSQHISELVRGQGSAAAADRRDRATRATDRPLGARRRTKWRRRRPGGRAVAFAKPKRQPVAIALRDWSRVKATARREIQPACHASGGIGHQCPIPREKPTNAVYSLRRPSPARSSKSPEFSGDSDRSPSSSTRFTRERSLVRNQPCPSRTAC